MSLLAPEGDVVPTTGTISRRRVLQGVAWGTPAVLLATAAPALAASGETFSAPTQPGSIVLSSTSAVYAPATSKLTVRGQVAYGGTASQAPILGTRVTVTFNGWWAGNQTPTGLPAGWTYVGFSAANGGGNPTFTFEWIGTTISYVNSTPSPLTATFANWPTDVTSITVAVAGTSLSVPVSATAAVTATAAASVVWNSTGNYSAGQYSFELRHNGPYNPAAAPVTALVLVATYDPAKVNAPTQTTVGNWQVTPLGVTNGEGTVRFTYAPGSLALNASTGSAIATFTLKSGVTKAAISFAGTYNSAGSGLTVPVVVIGQN